MVCGPCILAPLLLYFLPESPRWLIAKGRIAGARAILAAGAKRNNRAIAEEDIVLKQPPSTGRRRGTLLDIMRYPRLRTKTLVMYCNWFASSFMLYGIALNWQGLTGDMLPFCAI